MKAKLDENGYTLIEMLLVLSIVMIMTSSIIFVTTANLEKIEEKRFFKQFQLDIRRIQMISIAEQKYTYMYFTENGTKYVAKSSNVEILEYKLPSGVHFSKDSPLKEIIFTPNGSIKQFGNLRFETTNGPKFVPVYIGRGKLNYEE